MAPGIIYLDVDDEITSAATRIRRADGSRVAVVLPYGSRVATSRINFRLLSRDALTHEKRLSVIAPDGATRALAASAGLPVFGSVGEYEGSLEETAGPDGDVAGPTPAPAARGEGDGGDNGDGDEPSPAPPAVVVAAVPPAGVAVPGRAAERVPSARPRGNDAAPVPAFVPEPESEPRPRPATSIPVVGSRRPAIPRTPALVGAAVLALAVLVASVGAYVLLPAATVAVTPHEKVVGPLRFSVVADESVTEPDAVRRVVPATRLTLEVSVSDTFVATGRRVEQTRATGRVTFQSLDTGGSNTIPSGSIVSTEGGIEFRTLRSVTLGRAQIVPPLSVKPSTATVDVEAVRNGPSGNVPANAITVIPPRENPSITKVRNANATGGGTREEFAVVAQEDVDAALAALGGQLAEAFRERLADPSIVPEDTTIFPDTAQLGEPTPTVDVATLAGAEVEEFELGLTAAGSVVAVNPAPVTSIAETLLLAEIDDGHELVAGSTGIAPGDPVVDGQTVSFPVVAEARQVRIPDAAELEALILGKPLEEARELLAPYGDVELTLWPDWVTNVPTIDGRVEVEVRSPVPLGGSGSSPSASPGPSPAASPATPATPAGATPSSSPEPSPG